MQRVIRFQCANCGADVEVDREMRESLLRTGCAVCGAPVSERDFT